MQFHIHSKAEPSNFFSLAYGQKMSFHSKETVHKQQELSLSYHSQCTHCGGIWWDFSKYKSRNQSVLPSYSFSSLLHATGTPCTNYIIVQGRNLCWFWKKPLLMVSVSGGGVWEKLLPLENIYANQSLSKALERNALCHPSDITQVNSHCDGFSTLINLGWVNWVFVWILTMLK